MSILLMAIVLILIVVATVITKKLPFNFVLMIVPIVCALLLGHSVKETSDFVRVPLLPDADRSGCV